jgi:putative endonuclease
VRQTNVHQYYIYMVTNAWKNVLYTGVTNSLETRIWQYKNKAIPGFTKKYNCDRLVYFEVNENINQQIAREKQIKGWSRAKKDALVATMNPEWNDLAADWYGSNASAGDSSPSSRLGMTEGTRLGMTGGGVPSEQEISWQSP